MSERGRFITAEELDRERRDIAEAEALMLRGALKAAGVCLCQTEIEDPGEHIATCPNDDPEWEGPKAHMAMEVTVFHCEVCDTITGTARQLNAPPPVCCGRQSGAYLFSQSTFRATIEPAGLPGAIAEGAAVTELVAAANAVLRAEDRGNGYHRQTAMDNLRRIATRKDPAR